MVHVRKIGIALIWASSAGLVPVAAAVADCRCVYGGRYFGEGDLACIRTPQGLRLARCGKVSNLSSWKFTTQRCGPAARRPAPERSRSADLLPAVK